MDGVAGWDLGRRVSSKIGPAATKPAFLSKNKDLFVPNKLKEEQGEREKLRKFCFFSSFKRDRKQGRISN